MATREANFSEENGSKSRVWWIGLIADTLLAAHQILAENLLLYLFMDITTVHVHVLKIY
jgi:hypothetical protein